MQPLPRNPFSYGRELPPGRLVGRAHEIFRIIQILEHQGRLFLIGPRRFGKTSILREVEHQLEAIEHVVLRYDAERYETLHLLAQALLTGATRRLVATPERATKALANFFGRLRPELSYNSLDQTISVSIGATPPSRNETLLLMEVLDGINRMAQSANRRVSIILDEFQHVISIRGRVAEGQLRSVIQGHDHLGYVFAGSKQRMLMEMVATADRPFWQSGDRLFLGYIPRSEFLAFLTTAFHNTHISASQDVLAYLMDAAEEVPHNVQMLAHHCWNTAHVMQQPLTTSLVDSALNTLVLDNDAFYTQVWNMLTVAQKKTLKAVINERGVALYSQRVARQYDLATATIQVALAALEERGIVRTEESLGASRIRLEDPFFATWLRVSQM